MHSLDLILTLTGGLAGALILGYITHRLGLSPIVGYLLAGVVIGPNTPGFVANQHLAEELAEVGVVLLMFGVGLQFHVEELLAVRRVAIPGAIVQSAVATVLGALLMSAFGWSTSGAIVFGIALSVASTVVLIRVLTDNETLQTPTGHIAVGWLVVEDLFTVIALVVLPIVFGADKRAGGLGLALLVTGAKVAALVAFAAIVGTRVIPKVLDHVARTRSRELFTLAILVLALGIAVGSALVFHVSMALGAFLAGLVVGRSDYAQRAAEEALPLRDAFAVLFFVSVGMLLQPAALLEQRWLVLGTLAVILIGKPIAAFAITWALRYPLVTGLSVAVALAQIGEFSFMLSRVGRDLGLLTVEATNVLVAAAIVSIVLNPILFRAVRPIDEWTRAHPRLRRLVDRSR
jgi:monovalent cation:H+ antiporter-2, CPA2 family